MLVKVGTVDGNGGRTLICFTIFGTVNTLGFGDLSITLGMIRTGIAGAGGTRFLGGTATVFNGDTCRTGAKPLGIARTWYTGFVLKIIGFPYTIPKTETASRICISFD
jgi:hypothetical protein